MRTVLFIALMLLVVALAFIIHVLLTMLTVFVFAGFGVSIPFWPTFGALIIISMLLGGASSR